VKRLKKWRSQIDKDLVEQVFGLKLSIDQPGGLAKPEIPADAEILYSQSDHPKSWLKYHPRSPC
jgi:hypothetical protein